MTFAKHLSANSQKCIGSRFSTRLRQKYAGESYVKVLGPSNLQIPTPRPETAGAGKLFSVAMTGKAQPWRFFLPSTLVTISPQLPPLIQLNKYPALLLSTFGVCLAEYF